MSELSVYTTAAQPMAPAAQTEPAQGQTAPEQAQPVQPPSQDTFTWLEEKPEDKTLLEALEEARKKIEESKKRFQIKRKVRYGDMPVEAFSRLARARNKAQVNAAAGYARRRLAYLRAALRQDPEQRTAIRSAMAQMEKAVLRAGKKKRDLDRESLAEHRRRKAEEHQREREALRLKQELQRKRTLRSIREGGYLSEAAIEKQAAIYRQQALDAFKLPGSGEGAGSAPSAAQTPAGGEAAAPVAAEGFTAQA